MEELAELTIESIAAGGDGVARHEGVVVFVPRAAPGDRLRVHLRHEGRLARGRIDAILTPGPGRVSPRCRHYDADSCGGCQLQHLAYHSQLDAKRGIINDAMERIGRSPARVAGVAASPAPWDYRTKLTLAIREQQGRRSRLIGLRHRDDPDRVFELTECPITSPRIVAAWREVGDARDLLPAARTLSGAIRLDGESLVFVLNGGVEWPKAREFAERCHSLAVVRWHKHGGGIRTIADRRSAGAPAASFQQVNPGVSTALHALVLERALWYNPATAIDAYAGSGDTAASLHAHGVSVVAIEIDAEAAAYCGKRLPSPSRVVAARVELALPMLPPADVVVLNPPRGGVENAVTEYLTGASGSTRAILYVSCNPATLARDIRRLPSYRVSALTAFDMFPQTAHVETLCELVPERP